MKKAQSILVFCVCISNKTKTYKLRPCIKKLEKKLEKKLKKKLFFFSIFFSIFFLKPWILVPKMRPFSGEKELHSWCEKKFQNFFFFFNFFSKNFFLKPWILVPKMRPFSGEIKKNTLYRNIRPRLACGQPRIKSYVGSPNFCEILVQIWKI